MLEKKPKIVAVTHVSNVLGTINDVKRDNKDVRIRAAQWCLWTAHNQFRT